MKDWDWNSISAVCFSLVIFIISLYVHSNKNKTKDSPVQQPTQSEYKYDINEYLKQQEESKKSKEECLQIVGNYLKRYGHNVTYIFTTDPSLNNWKYNVRGTITNLDGTTRHFGVLYDYQTKTIQTFDIE